jgi:hypothetical protein
VSLEARLSIEEQRLKLQTAMADLASCAATTPDQIDATVNAVLHDLGADALDADRCIAYLPSGAQGAGFRVA